MSNTFIETGFDYGWAASKLNMLGLASNEVEGVRFPQFLLSPFGASTSTSSFSGLLMTWSLDSVSINSQVAIKAYDLATGA